MQVDESDVDQALQQIAMSLQQIVDRLGAPTMAVQPEYLSPTEAAKFLGCDLKTIENLITTRKIRYVQIGKQRGRVIAIAELRRFAESRTQRTAEEELKKRSKR